MSPSLSIWVQIVAYVILLLALWLSLHIMRTPRETGWKDLAQTYTYAGRISAQRCYNPNVSFKKEASWAGYGISLVIGTSPAGLYLYQLPPFQLAHPTLLVPWQDVHVGAQSTSLLDGPSVLLHLGNSPVIQMLVFGRLVEHIARYKNLNERDA